MEAPTDPILARALAGRARFLAETPRGYSPWLHFACFNVWGAAVIAWSLGHLSGPTAPQWLTVPLVFVVAQAAEWRLHRDLLHRRVPPLQIFYDAHTVSHHMLYVRGSMAIGEPRELRAVLFPWYAVFIVTALMAPLAAALGWLFGGDVGLLFMATSHAYFALYEWLHFAYHLPERWPLRRSWPLRPLADWHAEHHDPRVMQRANFGVTSPLWDYVRGTARRP
jgi:sterol desaturase/sphingolipid hydroxylase (fatty acid hydroxylase superfamily)